MRPQSFPLRHFTPEKDSPVALLRQTRRSDRAAEIPVAKVLRVSQDGPEVQERLKLRSFSPCWPGTAVKRRRLLHGISAHRRKKRCGVWQCNFLGTEYKGSSF